jgi:hypothetical protein
MKREEIIPKVKSFIHSGEEIKGIFQAQKTPTFIWHLLLGPFAFLSMKFFIITVTDRKIYFHKLRLSGREFDNTFYYEYHTIKQFKYRKGILQHTLFFILKSNEKIKLKAQAKGVKGALVINDGVLQFLESVIK